MFIEKTQIKKPIGPLYRNAKKPGFKIITEILIDKNALKKLKLNNFNDMTILTIK